MISICFSPFRLCRPTASFWLHTFHVYASLLLLAFPIVRVFLKVMINKINNPIKLNDIYLFRPSAALVFAAFLFNKLDASGLVPFLLRCLRRLTCKIKEIIKMKIGYYEYLISSLCLPESFQLFYNRQR